MTCRYCFDYRLCSEWAGQPAKRHWPYWWWKGHSQIYLSGMADHRLSNGDIVEHVVDLVEARVAELKAAMRH